MRKVQRLQKAFLFGVLGAILALAGTARAGENGAYFPLAPGAAWTYGDSAHTVRVTGVKVAGTDSVYSVSGLFGDRDLQVAGDRVEEWKDGKSRLLFDLGARVGADWTIAPMGASDLLDGSSVTVVSRSDTVKTPAGVFGDVVHLGLRPAPGLADAGVTDLWFAPGVGLVKWSEIWIGGVRTFALSGSTQSAGSSSGSAGTVQPGGDASVDTSATASLSGTVVEKTVDGPGAPVAGARVEVVRRAGARMGMADFLVEQGQTDAQGRFAFESLSAGNYQVSAYMDGYLPTYAQVTLVSGHTEVSLGMQRESTDGYPNVNAWDHGGFKAEVATDRREYGPKDSIRVRYRLTNTGGTPATLVFGNAQRQDYILDGPKGVVWQWSRGVFYAMGGAQETLAPGDSLEFRNSFLLSQIGADTDGWYSIGGVLAVSPDQPGAVSRDETEGGVKFVLNGAGAGGETNPGPVASLTTDRAAYGLKDTVWVQYRLENSGRDTLRLSYPSTQRYDLVLENDSGTVWTWSSTRQFALMPGSETLAPGASIQEKAEVPLQAAGVEKSGTYVLRMFRTVAPDSRGVTRAQTEAAVKFPVGMDTVPPPGPLPLTFPGEAGLATDRRSYAPGDSVLVSYRYLNNTDGPLVLNYPTGQRYDLVLEGPEGPVWRWSDGRMFTQMVHEETLNPGQITDFQTSFLLPRLVLDQTYVLRAYLAVTPGENGGVEQAATEARDKFWISADSTGTPAPDAAATAVRKADFDDNGTVNFGDFLLLARCYGKAAGDSGYRAAFDLNGDGMVDFGDFVAFSRLYGKRR